MFWGGRLMFCTSACVFLPIIFSALKMTSVETDLCWLIGHKNNKWSFCGRKIDSSVTGRWWYLTFRAHHAPVELIFVLCQRKTVFKRTNWKHLCKRHNAKYDSFFFFFFYCYFSIKLLYIKFPEYNFVFFSIVFPPRPPPGPWVGLRSCTAGTLRSVSTTLWIQWMCRKPCSIALYVMYIMNKDCILFRFS